MKYLLIFCCLVCTLQADVDYSEYAQLLARYVEPEGIRYDAWAAHEADLAALEEFLDSSAEVDLTSIPEAGQKAFYINLYNAAMLKAVFDHWPVESVREIGLLPFSIFKVKFIRQGDRMLSLDEVEKEILLKEYFDPRIHFAVNCASESCPPLRAEPFVGERLEAQLDSQARSFARSKRAARIDHKNQLVAYSELLKWYADDFPGEHPGAYLNQYREDILPFDYRIDWIDYDWSLNATD